MLLCDSGALRHSFPVLHLRDQPRAKGRRLAINLHKDFVQMPLQFEYTRIC